MEIYDDSASEKNGRNRKEKKKKNFLNKQKIKLFLRDTQVCDIRWSRIF